MEKLTFLQKSQNRPKTIFPLKNLSVHIILILDATSVPNLAFFGLLSPGILFGKKTVTHPNTHLIL